MGIGGILLFHHRYKFGGDDALIGSDEAEAVDASGCYDDAIGGIAKGVAESSDLTGNLEINWNDAEISAGVEGFEDYTYRGTQPTDWHYSDLHKCDGTQSQQLPVPHSLCDYAVLIS
jgi:hypothetical protein